MCAHKGKKNNGSIKRRESECMHACTSREAKRACSSTAAGCMRTRTQARHYRGGGSWGEAGAEGRGSIWWTVAVQKKREKQQEDNQTAREHWRESRHKRKSHPLVKCGWKRVSRRGRQRATRQARRKRHRIRGKLERRKRKNFRQKGRVGRNSCKRMRAFNA